LGSFADNLNLRDRKNHSIKDKATVEIEFGGNKDLKSRLNEAFLSEKLPLSKNILRVIVVAIYIFFIFWLGPDIIRRQAYFSRAALGVLGSIILVYFGIVHPVIAPFLSVLLDWKGSQVRKGIVSIEGITFTTPNGLTKLPWKQFYKANKTETSIVLFAEFTKPMAFPQNLFKTETDWHKFENWVDYYVKEN
jgi:hypothetical protein